MLSLLFIERRLRFGETTELLRRFVERKAEVAVSAGQLRDNPLRFDKFGVGQRGLFVKLFETFEQRLVTIALLLICAGRFRRRVARFPRLFSGSLRRVRKRRDDGGYRAKRQQRAYRRDDAAKRRALSAASSPKPTPLFNALDDGVLDVATNNATSDVAETSVRSESSGRGSFFCVGDVKQAIYGWRGGVAEIFNEIESSLPGVETAELTLNWRSCPTVIETVNRLFLPLTQNPLFQYD
ncbi:MAG: UvrD-helicase domain-containing protein, partial [Thermoguttaceae bacterium]|nr:UvrD-helicase domain-containing protein [Thermoguttaceae bacterium]